MEVHKLDMVPQTMLHMVLAFLVPEWDTERKTERLQVLVELLNFKRKTFPVQSQPSSSNTDAIKL